MTDVSISSSPAPAHDLLSATQVRELLNSIDGLHFDDPQNFDTIKHVLTELAWWDNSEEQYNKELAIDWINRIYPEAEKLRTSSTSPLYGKCLRRLRTICGRTSDLPAMFELVPEDYMRGSSDAIFQSRISDVWRGKNNGTGQVVALKKIRLDRDKVEQYKQQLFRKEAIVWQLLRHDHIVPFLGILGQNSSLTLVSVWMDNGRLKDYLASHLNETPLRFLRHVISGLEHIHGLGLAHGDIKGDNILVDSLGNARIADFGTNVVLQYTGVVTTSGGKGTVEYKAPEIIEAESKDIESLDGEEAKNVKLAQLPTRESDVYATSVLIWELYAGEYPYQSPKLPDYAIANKILTGRRLPRDKCHLLNTSEMDPLWDMVERGWHQDPKLRCGLSEMDTVIEQLQ